MKSNHVVLKTVLLGALITGSRAPAQIPFPEAPPPQTAPRTSSKLQSFAFEGADLDTVMKMYCEWTGKVYLKNDSVKATITLDATNKRLTTSECIELIEAILAMNNIALVPYGEKFVRVVQANLPDLGGQGLAVHLDPDKKHTASERLVTQLIQLKNVTISDVQTAVQHLMHAYGKIQTMDRSNSLLITDTANNIKRIRELIEFMDEASARIEPRFYQILYADATEIASRLNEIITIAQSDQSATTRGVRTPPGVIRSRTTARTATPTQAIISGGKSDTGATLIQGVVKVLADQRTNILIIFSQKENFTFFDKIIKVLDIEVDPAITFEVVSLEYADAEELSGTLNDLVGAAQGSRSSSSGSRSSTGSSQPATSGLRASSSRSSSAPRVTPNSTGGSALESLSKLSENTKILADKRTNSILLMGGKTDINAIKNVISSLDIMLEQVMIEAAIFEVTLTDTLRHGMDWLFQNDNGNEIGAWDGDSLVSSNGLGLVRSGALSYYRNLTGINTTMAVELAATDGNVRLLNTPVIMTTDNTEARLSVGRQRPVVTATDTFGSSTSSLRSSYEYKDIGIQLTVTPRINPQRVVVMEILQKADQLGTDVEIDGNPVPTILNREFEAQVSVPDGTTVALGGLINTTENNSSSKIPILGDIPLIGHYLFSSINNSSEQVELVVLLTPYVLTNDEEMQKKTETLYDATDMKPEDWPENGWSKSPLQYRKKIDPKVDEDEDAPQVIMLDQPEPQTKPMTEAPVVTSELPELTAQEKAELDQLLHKSISR